MVNQNTVPSVLKTLAQVLGTTLQERTVQIPEAFGNGYCTGYVFNEYLRMLISNYELHEDVLIENPEIHESGNLLFFKFQNIIPVEMKLTVAKEAPGIPSVLIANSRLNTDEVISIHSNIATITIEADVTYLQKQFDVKDDSPLLSGLLKNTQPLLFEQLIYPTLQHIVQEMLTEKVASAFELLFLRIKTEELICRLLMELGKRGEQNLHALNGRDVQHIYRVKEQVLANLKVPPVLEELAALACMSPSKLKRLFKQIFGCSIYNYYQQFRMKEAARLLREEKLSVSETGYQMGFENISHFARVFEAHFGMKPKKWSMSLNDKSSNQSE